MGQFGQGWKEKTELGASSLESISLTKWDGSFCTPQMTVWVVSRSKSWRSGRGSGTPWWGGSTSMTALSTTRAPFITILLIKRSQSSDLHPHINASQNRYPASEKSKKNQKLLKVATVRKLRTSTTLFSWLRGRKSSSSRNRGCEKILTRIRKAVRTFKDLTFSPLYLLLIRMLRRSKKCWRQALNQRYLKWKDTSTTLKMRLNKDKRKPTGKCLAALKAQGSLT